MSTTTCEPCAMRAAGKTSEAESAEMIRAQRLLLAFLNAQPDVQESIASEVRECRDCMGRLVATYLSMTAGALSQALGGTEIAARAVEQGLLEDLDGQGNS
ncbi:MULTISPECIES: hypothetical protein [Mycolicibacterium]|uniref:hypothetical protein n=1 Tax=Mycolicibacterium TaxID=1866885 RepID=UPI0010424A55|nr:MULTISPECIES: hypothetical protein [Mycolicibacterium]MCW1821434.1 hypothetical protein [Mycolicibacterium senegalense]